MTSVRVLEWLNGWDTGISSKAIVARMEHIWTDKPRRDNYPRDPSDLGRCIRLLSLVPEYRPRLVEMREESPVWAQLVDHWDELEKLYFLGLSRPASRAPECYDRMRELIQAGGGL